MDSRICFVFAVYLLYCIVKAYSQDETTFEDLKSFNFDYKFPDVDITVYKPRGLRITIPDDPNVRSFLVYGRVIRSDNDVASLDGATVHTNEGHWFFYDPVALEIGDTLHYSVYAAVGGMNVVRDNLYSVKKFNVTESVSWPHS